MPTVLILLLIALSVALVAVFVFRPQITATRGGKMAAFLALFALPLLCLGMGTSSELEHAKSTEFCRSCHIMEPYGKSLRVDDPQHLAAAHFQNHRVPADEACYTCHTNYAMFGGIKAKLGGLRHIYVITSERLRPRRTSSSTSLTIIESACTAMPARVPLKKAPCIRPTRTCFQR